MSFFKENRHLMVAAIIISFAAILFLGFVRANLQAANSGKILTNEIIRLHVLANSDSEQDQEIKLLVRDAIQEMLTPLLADVGSVEEVRNIITENLDAIQFASTRILENSDTEYGNVSAQLNNAVDFPNMTYGGILLPRGSYEALQVVIGEGEGQNWWCVVFPNLCLVDIAVYDDLSQEQLAELAANLNGNVDIRPRFMVAEIWEKIRGLF
ncbi:MAG: stage II sporulation protein R [Defluviitaleaceae bacterium]|nr:stage II sporulation protein R [Defluviitaleaceae bacterium]